MITESTTTLLRDGLGGGFAGPTFGPGDPGYDHERRVWNATVDKHPALIARCTSPEDVATAVRAARGLDVPLSVRGGGHQVAGLSVCDGLVVDLGGMRSGVVDPVHQRARVGGGSLLGDVDALTQHHGLLAPAGVISHTGLGGLALGGGVGWTCRNFGLTSDNIVGADLVTSDGELLRIDEETDPDLLWALRGGGGNFGVVTTFELKLYEVSDVLFGQAVFELPSAPRAIAHYRELMADAPDQITAVLVLRNAPALPAVPPHLVGRPVVVINAVWSGDPAVGEPTLRRLIEEGQPTASRVGLQRYLDLQRMQDDMHPHGMYNHMKSRYLTSLDDGAIDSLVDAAASNPGDHSQIEVLRLGGAIARVPEDATAFSGREAAYIANVVATWTDPAQGSDHVRWARRTYDALDPVGTSAGYVNFLGEEPDRARSVYAGATYDRLCRIKARVDPTNVLRGNIAVPPADLALQ